MPLQSVGKIEEELKQLGTRYSEKKQALLQHQRKKGYGSSRLCSPVSWSAHELVL